MISLSFSPNYQIWAHDHQKNCTLSFKNKEKIIPQVITSLNDLKLTFCENCGNVDISSPCSICNSNKRKSEKVCVVEDIGDLWAIEKSKAYDGHYHVLGGVLSAIDGIGPDELNISSLMKKSKQKINEIILATNATVEGQITAEFIADSCEKQEILVTRLAQGIPIGGELDSVDYNTLSTAFSSRSEMKLSFNV